MSSDERLRLPHQRGEGCRAGLKTRPTFGPTAALPPPFVGHDPRAFTHGYELIRGDAGNHLACPARPEDLDTDGRESPETEVEARIVRRIETRLADHGLSLGPISCVDEHARPDGAVVRLDSLQFDFDPMPGSRHVIAQERWRFVQVDDEHVDIAVIVEVPERAPTAAVRLRDARPRLLLQLLERAVTEIPEHRARSSGGVLRQLALDIGIDVA